MPIKIGEHSFSPRKPRNLDELLQASSGCNATEISRMLAGDPNPGQIALALRPFLPEDAPSVPELAVTIGVADVCLVVAVRKLYAADAPIEVAEKPTA